ncbi:flagellar biosynthesis protein FlgA [Phytoactinopolyspora alkaliphila]|uniref:Flagellar biosynthesis protein FlgA n=1 Tax=Phytoactinopolyspora alkaliphila TaxID=1783498 RepID=A0A6N9YN86_9ACTN|nr:SAF domain-containing protein [Phytoactinopolyspora alkaliphila]NED96308.1 flagellar biosynthesis protein FlgA [Phytoactinopolyspora alkaliphila]
MATSTTQSGDVSADRQRTREQRGIRSNKSVGQTDRLPTPPRQRRPALAALAVLLIVGGAAMAALLALRADERVPVLVVQNRIQAGQQIRESDLGTTPVASEGTLLIPASQLDRVVGQFSTVQVEPGQLLDTSMIGGSGMLTDGNAAVGAALANGRFPASGLHPGDVVDLVAVRQDGTGEIIADRVRVSSVSGAGGGSDPVAGGGINATFIVPVADRAEVAAWASNNALSVVLIERGTAVGPGSAPDSGDTDDEPADDEPADDEPADDGPAGEQPGDGED